MCGCRVQNYRKACLKVLWPFWGQHLEAYRTGAALNHRLKAGIMTMIGARYTPFPSPVRPDGPRARVPSRATRPWRVMPWRVV